MTRTTEALHRYTVTGPDINESHPNPGDALDRAVTAATHMGTLGVVTVHDQHTGCVVATVERHTRSVSVSTERQIRRAAA